MNEQTEKSPTPAIVYIIGITAIVAAIAVGVLTFAHNRAKEDPLTDDPGPAVTIQPQQLLQNDQPEEQAEIVDKPVLPETTAAPETETQPPQTQPAGIPIQPEPEELVLSLPLDGMVSKAFSDTIPVYSLTMNDYRTHSGVDLEAEIGSAVYACARGSITSIHEDPFMGMCITIDHGDGLVSRYMNLAAQLPEGIAAGCAVEGGTLIAAVGDTALSEMASEPHLHFELLQDGTAVDPADYLPLNSPAGIAE